MRAETEAKLYLIKALLIGAGLGSILVFLVEGVGVEWTIVGALTLMLIYLVSMAYEMKLKEIQERREQDQRREPRLGDRA